MFPLAAQDNPSNGVVSEGIKLWALFGATIVSVASIILANKVRTVLNEKGGVVEKIDELEETEEAQNIALATLEQQGEDRDRRIGELERRWPRR